MPPLLQSDLLAEVDQVHPPGTQRSYNARAAAQAIYGAIDELAAFGHFVHVEAGAALESAVQEWPKMAYGPNGKTATVANQDALSALGEGWGTEVTPEHGSAIVEPSVAHLQSRQPDTTPMRAPAEVEGGVVVPPASPAPAGPDGGTPYLDGKTAPDGTDNPHEEGSDEHAAWERGKADAAVAPLPPTENTQAPVTIASSGTLTSDAHATHDSQGEGFQPGTGENSHPVEPEPEGPAAPPEEHE